MKRRDAFSDLFRKAPMLRFALGLMAGIMAAEYVPGDARRVLAVVIGVGSGVLAFSALARKGWAGRIFLPVFYAVVVSVGWYWALDRMPKDPLSQLGEEGGTATMILTVADTPVPSQRCWKVPATAEQLLCDGGWQPTAGGVMLFVEKDSAAARLRYGERIVVRGFFERPSYRDGNFDYGRYLFHRGMRGQCYLPSGCWRSLGTAVVGLRGWAKEVQRRLVERVQASSLPQRQQGVVEALVLGWKGDVDGEVRLHFREAGVAHLLAVSGLHVGIVGAVAGACLAFLGRRRWQRLLKGGVQLGAIWLFAVVSGLAPSTVRAALMFSLVLVGDMFFKRAYRMNNLSVAAVVILAVNPWALFDVSFQLSYTAVAGLFVFYPKFSGWQPRVFRSGWWRPLGRLWDLAGLSLAAQLSMLPLMLYHFHEFPLYFLVANVVVMPFAGLLLVSGIAVVLSMGWGGIASAVQWLTEWELEVLESFLAWLGVLPHAFVTDIRWGYLESVLLSLFLVCLGGYLWADGAGEEPPRSGSGGEMPRQHNNRGLDSLGGA